MKVLYQIVSDEDEVLRAYGFTVPEDDARAFHTMLQLMTMAVANVSANMVKESENEAVSYVAAIEPRLRKCPTPLKYGATE